MVDMMPAQYTFSLSYLTLPTLASYLLPLTSFLPLTSPLPPPSLPLSDKLSVCVCYNSQACYYGKRELSIVRHHIASIHLTKLCMLPWIWVDWLLHLALWCLHSSFFNNMYNTVRYYASIYLPTHTTTCHLLSLSSFLFPSGVFFVFCLVLDICFCDGDVLPLSVSVVRPSIHHPSIHTRRLIPKLEM